MIAYDHSIVVNIDSQTLILNGPDTEKRKFTVSTARNGPGQQMGSECTPLGRHIVRARIGDGQAINTVFVARRPTGELYTPRLREQYPDRDWILTRILWLSGTNRGYNRLGEVDTMLRFIYIHGCPDDDELGKPGSHGCIKMRNIDVIALFDAVPVGTPVNIVTRKTLDQEDS